MFWGEGRWIMLDVLGDSYLSNFLKNLKAGRVSMHISKPSTSEAIRRITTKFKTSLDSMMSLRPCLCYRRSCLKSKQSQPDSSVGKGTCHLAWRRKFHPWRSQGGQRESTLKLFLWVPYLVLCVYMHAHTYTITHIDTNECMDGCVNVIKFKKLETESW